MGPAVNPEKGKRIELVFVVNGENVPIEINTAEPLFAAVQKALEQSHNTGRPPEEWEVRDSNGTLLDVTRKIEDFGFKSGTRLFLSLRVGAGGNRERRHARVV